MCLDCRGGPQPWLTKKGSPGGRRMSQEAKRSAHGPRYFSRSLEHSVIEEDEKVN